MLTKLSAIIVLVIVASLSVAGSVHDLTQEGI